ncbi:hypothetical protein [Methanolobus sp.]|uniref:hypothetical protein n=1 Tax=Methanolobus sp. TaxID=1874737 RepID=UPI0025DDF018|nr:hypothetical protein [Methanolobus sp.]
MLTKNERLILSLILKISAESSNTIKIKQLQDEIYAEYTKYMTPGLIKKYISQIKSKRNYAKEELRNIEIEMDELEFRKAEAEAITLIDRIKLENE